MPTVSSLAVLGEISVNVTLIKVDDCANVWPRCLDSGSKKVFLLFTSVGDIGTVSPDFEGVFNLIL